MSERKPAPKKPPIAEAPNVHAEKKYLRFDVITRIEHWMFMLSFTTLALTGLVQKYAESPISIFIVDRLLGGIETTRMIHHVAATIMMVVTVYHIGIVGYRIYVKRVSLSMLPGTQDFRAFYQSIRYYLGLSKNKAQQGRYTYEEKLEYWAVVWGTVVMVITGFMMWNPLATTRILPGEFIPAAKAAHGGEALLAVLAIIIWHLYHVLVKTFNRSMFTGYVDEEEMLDEHLLELADIKAGINVRHLDPAKVAQRRKIFLPSYGVFAAVLLVGIVYFVTFETTAVAIRPPAEQVEVFVPLTPTPLPTPVPTRTSVPGGLTSWTGGVADVFQQRCGICHNSTAKVSGLDLTTYQSALTTGTRGPAIVPGDPDASEVIIIQEQGGHAEQLSQEEINQLRQWIANGAPEQ